MSKQQPQTKKRSIVFFLVPHFTLLPFAGAIETLRIANRMLGYAAYEWRLASVDGQKVYSSSGIGIEVNSSLADERRFLGGENRPNMAIVCSGIYVEEFNNKSVNAWLREAYNRNVAVGSLCTGAHVLAQAGLLNGKRCAIHWENLPGFSETFPQAEVYADLYEVDGNLYTCAGGTASLDMMLNLIGQDFGEALVNRVNESVNTIATAAKEQATGLAEINTSVNHMDQMTQQNAAMVEETSAAGQSLAEESYNLRQLLSRLKVNAQQAMGHRRAA